MTFNPPKQGTCSFVAEKTAKFAYRTGAAILEKGKTVLFS
jgi:hypothetical protein